MNTGGDERVVTAMAADARFALPLNVVTRVLAAVAVMPLPGSRPPVLGFIDMHGDKLVVVDLRQHLGLPPRAMMLSDRLVIVETSVGRVALRVDLGFEDAAACADWFSSHTPTREHVETLASYLTIGETYFFRERRTLDALSRRILSELVQSRQEGQRERPIRIWSAGCCTGEEPYSVAIMLDALIPDRHDWDITLLATDINPVFLRKAARGLYRSWSFRSCPAELKERYFRPASKEEYELSASIRRLVTFEYLNLAADQYPSLVNNTNAMDIILCRNVLMYFEASMAEGIVAKFANCLVDGGWLVVSPSETSMVSGQWFESEQIDDACLFRCVRGGAGHSDPGVDRQARASPMRPGISGSGLHPAAPVPVAREALAAVCRKADARYRRGDYPAAIEALLPCVTSELCASDAPARGAALRILARAYANQGAVRDGQAGGPALACGADDCAQARRRRTRAGTASDRQPV